MAPRPISTSTPAPPPFQVYAPVLAKNVQLYSPLVTQFSEGPTPPPLIRGGGFQLWKQTLETEICILKKFQTPQPVSGKKLSVIGWFVREVKTPRLFCLLYSFASWESNSRGEWLSRRLRQWDMNRVGIWIDALLVYYSHVYCSEFGFIRFERVYC